MTTLDVCLWITVTALIVTVLCQETQIRLLRRKAHLEHLRGEGMPPDIAAALEAQRKLDAQGLRPGNPLGDAFRCPYCGNGWIHNSARARSSTFLVDPASLQIMVHDLIEATAKDEPSVPMAHFLMSLHRICDDQGSRYFFNQPALREKGEIHGEDPYPPNVQPDYRRLHTDCGNSTHDHTCGVEREHAKKGIHPGGIEDHFETRDPKDHPVSDFLFGLGCGFGLALIAVCIGAIKIHVTTTPGDKMTAKDVSRKS